MVSVVDYTQCSVGRRVATLSEAAVYVLCMISNSIIYCCTDKVQECCMLHFTVLGLENGKVLEIGLYYFLSSFLKYIVGMH